MASTQSGLDLRALVSPQDREDLLPIEFSYDYLPARSEEQIAHSIDFKFPARDELLEELGRNSIALDPRAAGISIHTGLAFFRQNKHWSISVEHTSRLLRLFADDATVSDVSNTNGRALVDLANKELKKKPQERYSLFSTYMFPYASKDRAALLAQTIFLIVTFDDVWEYADQDNIQRVQDDLVARLDGSVPPVMSATPLQKCLTDIRNDLLEHDKKAGNGGVDVLAALTNFCRHSDPMFEFDSVRQYLDYRYRDVAMIYSYAGTKFSIESDVDLATPKLQHYLQLVGDHVSIQNDLASYKKEHRDFGAGQTKHLINVVAVIQKVDPVASSDDAKMKAYELQLQTERDIVFELEHLEKNGYMTAAEWKFVEAVLLMAAGNLFTAVVISRYGGEDARIAAAQEKSNGWRCLTM